MRLGVSKKNITPKTPVELAGFAHRLGNYDDVYQDIYIRAFWLETKANDVLLIVGDFLWWDDNGVKTLKRRIEEEYSIPQAFIVFSATHNHSAPQTSQRFSIDLGRPSLDYIDQVMRTTMQCVQQAKSCSERVELYTYAGESHIGVNRRRSVNGEVCMMPNNSGSIDRDLTVSQFKTLDGKPRAIWIHHTCHPTSTDANVVSGEYTGVCCEKLEEQFPNAVVAILQGFSGDIRPNLVDEGEFVKGTIVEMQDLGKQFFQEVINICESEGMACDIQDVHTAHETLPMTFGQPREDVEVPDWPDIVQDQSAYNIELHYIDFGSFQWLACNAEVVHEYGLFLKRLKPNLLPLGCANGMVGYIPTANQIRSGGYEADESVYYFGYPGPLTTDIQSRFEDKLHSLIVKINETKEQESSW